MLTILLTKRVGVNLIQPKLYENTIKKFFQKKNPVRGGT